MAQPAASVGAADPALTTPPLAGADLYDWMALRRVSGGGIARMGDHWLEHGHRIPGYIADALTVLCDNDAVALAELDVCSCAGNARPPGRDPRQTRGG